MPLDVERFITTFSSTGNASDADIHSIERHFGCKLPIEYIIFLKARNDGEGFVGPQYLTLWNAHEVIQMNIKYEAEKYAPGLLLFDSSGGGEGFAFDLRVENISIVAVPFIGMSLNDACQLASSFNGFLEHLYESDGKLI